MWKIKELIGKIVINPRSLKNLVLYKNDIDKYIDYWEKIIKISPDDKFWQKLLRQQAPFEEQTITIIDIENHIKTYYAEQLKQPEIMAKILGDNNEDT